MIERILYTNSGGFLSIVVPVSGLAKDAAKDIPNDVVFEIVNESEIPQDRTFRNAWEHDRSAVPQKIKTNMIKARPIAHMLRRKKRDELMKPLDIKATIPVEAAKAETDRQAIRNNFDVIQADIDSAVTEAQLKQILLSNQIIA